jgi:sugar phosphate isomerase/epimerase
MTILPGVKWPHESADSSLARAADELARRAEEAARVGVALSVEAHVGSVADTPELALELVERAPGLKLTVDYTHFISEGFFDDDCEPLLEHARHVHVRGARPGRLQAAVKENTIDHARMVRELRRLEYPGFVCCEYVWVDWRHCNEVDNMAETILLRDELRAELTGVRVEREAAPTYQ